MLGADGRYEDKQAVARAQERLPSFGRDDMGVLGKKNNYK